MMYSPYKASESFSSSLIIDKNSAYNNSGMMMRRFVSLGGRQGSGYCRCRSHRITVPVGPSSMHAEARQDSRNVSSATSSLLLKTIRSSSLLQNTHMSIISQRKWATSAMAVSDTTKEEKIEEEEMPILTLADLPTSDENEELLRIRHSVSYGVTSTLNVHVKIISDKRPPYSKSWQGLK